MSKNIKASLTLALFCAAAICAMVAFLRPPMLEDPPAGTVILDRDGMPLRVRLAADDSDLRPVNHASISPWVIQALIAAEDKRFFQHPGIDPLAILRAAGQNLRYRRRISGASTLTTQVIRMAEPRRRTPSTKLIEAFKAIGLERDLDKQAILEQYLNRAPFGGNLHGIESAAQRYFGKSAADLTLAEAALLAGLPQAPSRLRPDRYPDAAFQRMQYVLERMEAVGFINAGQRAQALRQPLDARAVERSFHAPHFSDWVLEHYRKSTGTVRTTLDSALQYAIENLVALHFRSLAGQGVTDAAVVVIDVESGAVRAMLGSPDYHHHHHHGMFNSALAIRSPGSALKPLIYALALEQGMMSPGTMLDDSPMILRDTSFVNFDQTFRGAVSVRDALVASLNIPALRVTAMVGLRETIDGLHALGLSSLDRPAGDYGLGIALGGGDVRLLDLVNAYACLARGGYYRPYRLIEDDVADRSGHRVFSPETAFMIADMLGGPERSLDVFGHAADARLPRMAWKTGTSSGFRDAWTIAWNPQYVVGVWLGNHDGSGSPALVGARSAAPLAGAVFRYLERRADGAVWFIPPETLRQRTLADGTREWYVPGVSVDPRTQSPSVEPLRIVSPVSGSVFRVQPENRGEQVITLRARGMEPGTPLHWFANGEYLGQSADTLPWTLHAGKWKFTGVTPDGVRATATIRVTAAVRPTNAIDAPPWRPGQRTIECPVSGIGMPASVNRSMARLRQRRVSSIHVPAGNISW